MSNLLDLSAKISLDTSSYDKGLNDSSSKMSGFGDKLKNGLSTAAKVGVATLTTLATSAAAVTTAFTKMVNSVADSGDHIDKQSQKIGMSAEAYQEWSYILDRNGASVDGLQASMKTLSTQAQSNAEEFQKLGIAQEELRTLSPEQLFSRVVKGLQGMKGSTERTATAAKLLGRSATELQPLFNQTAEDTEELRQKAHDLGLVMSDEAVTASATYKDSLTDLQGAFTGLKNNLAEDFLPALTNISDGMTGLFTGEDGAVEKISQGIADVADLILEKTPELIDMVLPIIEGIAGAIIENAPELLQAGADVIGDIIGAIPDAMKMITDFLNTDSLPKLISDLCDQIIENIPAIISAGVDLFSALIDNVTGIIDNLSEKIGPFLVSLVTELTKKENINKMIDGGVKLLTHLIDDVDKILDGIMDGIFALIDGIFDLLTDPKALARIMLAGLKLGAKLIAGLIKSLTGLNLLEKIPVIGDLFAGFSNAIDSATDSIIGNIDNMIAQLDADAEAAGAYSSGGRSFGGDGGFTAEDQRNEKFGRVEININGDVKAEDVATEVENRLAGKMAGAGVA